MCCNWLECDECEDDDCDRFVKRLGPSRDTDKRAHDSSVCSGIMPKDTELLHTFELVAVKSAGVDCDSSWSVLNQFKKINDSIVMCFNGVLCGKQQRKREKIQARC